MVEGNFQLSYRVRKGGFFVKKKYFEPETDLILLKHQDVLTESLGDEHGDGVPGIGDEDWDFIEIN